ncbi:MAG: hypothetical protein IKO40_07590 [Kiritimatiellae bacterium]|nr:hypothetical protein [Kiritimatiellia bacterium]
MDLDEIIQDIACSDNISDAIKVVNELLETIHRGMGSKESEGLKKQLSDVIRKSKAKPVVRRRIENVVEEIDEGTDGSHSIKVFFDDFKKELIKKNNEDVSHKSHGEGGRGADDASDEESTLLWHEHGIGSWKLIPNETLKERVKRELPGFGEKRLQEKSEDKAHVVAAATPLTGVSAIGREHAIVVLKDKLRRLLDGPFDKVVLKTVYLDYLPLENDGIDEEKLFWPELQIQSQHRARCLRSVSHPRTLWNTGKTALETVTPQMLNELLVEIQNDSRFTENDKKNIIVSLGSKYPQSSVEELNGDVGALGLSDEYKGTKGEGDKFNYNFHIYRTPDDYEIGERFSADVNRVWDFLFEAVFGSGNGQNTSPAGKPFRIDQKYFPWVEINVRHYLRECVAFHLGGNEYLSPEAIDAHFGRHYRDLESEFRIWLQIVDSVARKYHKKLLLKLPFRGDLLFFIRLILEVRKECPMESETKDYGIQGISLINAFKAAVSEPPDTVPKYSPAWYGRTTAWNDAKDKTWKYQMSGELLAGPRNEILAAIFKEFPDEMKNMELHIGGGVMTNNEIKFLKKLHPDKNDVDRTNYVQIGTWGLLDLDLQAFINAKYGGVNTTEKELNHFNSKDCGIIKGPSNKSNSGSETGHDSENSPLPQSDDTKKIEYRFAFVLKNQCKGCMSCSKTFYCDSFLSRVEASKELLNTERKGTPLMDPRNCTGCGLCVQCCTNGAIQLFKPEHFVCLIGEDAKVAWKAHKMLTDAQIPHFVYTRKQLSDIVGKKALGTMNLYELWKSACIIEKNNTNNLSVEKCPVVAVKETSGSFQYDFYSADGEHLVENGKLEELNENCCSCWENEKIPEKIPACFHEILQEVGKRMGKELKTNHTEKP